ncbi:MAG: hypothetical protein COB51_09045 [Moraxellaceae bacterium]|nr:MAG: hypothetical protein COB51_09045 [Moraxellaceae bacterium]
MSLSVNETISEVAKLLNALDEVEVLRAQGDVDVIMIKLTIASFDSLLLLNYIAETVNANLISWAQYRPGSVEALADPARALHYRIMSKSESEGTGDAVRVIEYFGGALVKEAHAAGKLTISDANRLLKEWNVMCIEF